MKNIDLSKALAGLFFSIGNGFMFFAMSYAYRVYDLPKSYAPFVIILGLAVGIFAVIVGIGLLAPTKKSK